MPPPPQSSPHSGNGHFGVRSLCSGANGDRDKLSHSFDERPTRCAQNDDCDRSGSEILLVLEVRVSGDENLVALRFGTGEQFTVFERGPATFIRGRNFVPRQQVPQGRWRALIEENPHLRRSQGAPGGVLQYSACLLQGDAGEQLNELSDGDTVFKVLEQGRDRHARTSENPCSADAFGVAFHCCAT